MAGSRVVDTQKDRRLLTGSVTGLPDLEFFFRLCFSRFPHPVIVTDIHSCVLFLNNSAQDYTGYTLAAGNRLVCSDFLRSPQDDRPTPLEECIRLGTLHEFKVHLRNYAGRWLPFLLSAQLVNDSPGNPAGCLFILRTGLPAALGLGDSGLNYIFASVIDHFPMPFFMVDTNLTITYMNEHLEKLTGFSSAEVINRMSCSELLRTSSCHTDDCLLKQAIENRRPIAGLRRTVFDRQGREIPVAVHCSMITDSENRVIGGFKALRDVTLLHEAEQKIRMLVEITQEGILMIDENDRIIYANSKMAEILKHSKDDLVGKDVDGLLPVQLRAIERDLVLKIDKEDFQEVRFCTIQPAENSNRSDRIFETCIVVTRIGKGFITCMYFNELTRHIQMERELLSANSFLNNIIRSSPDGIVVADLEGNVLVYNDSAERILGYGPEEVTGQPGSLYKFIDPELAKENMRRMRHAEYGLPGKLSSTRLTLAGKNAEEVPVSFSAAIISERGREIGTVGIFSDLRERMRMIKELEDTRTQLMQAEKIASIGRLAAGVAHEINNPLAGILIFADILMRDLASTDTQGSKDIQEIINQTMRCKEIVARLLEFSRRSVDQAFDYDINSVVERSAELVRHQAAFHNIEFSFDLQPDIPTMMGDPGQVQQVFINLIMNAGTAMNGRGKIRVTSRFERISEQVILEFSDSGPGIPAEIISKVFEPFFTTKAPGEGTGLGLSVAYGIIRRHGGSISVRNPPWGGAVFTVMLPLKCPEKTVESEFAC